MSKFSGKFDLFDYISGMGGWFDKDGNKKYEGIWKDGMFEIENGVWFEFQSNETILKSINNCIIY